MKLAYVTAGAAKMYCGSCIHDNTLAAALIRKGHQVTLVPTYTIPRTDEPRVSLESVFYGAINVYLRERWPIFRLLPESIGRVLDRPGLLSWVSRFSSSTSASDLGALTVSILKGAEGPQKNETVKLVQWLESNIQPDLVHLTNSMFLGLVPEIQEKLGVPVLCSLQGEDLFLEGLPEPYKSTAVDLIRSQAKRVEAFVSPSRAYADYMAEFLAVDREKIFVVPLGLNLSGHGAERPDTDSQQVTIGYLARICPEKGLHVLVDAFEQLVRREPKLNLRLEIAGYLGPRDQAYFDRLSSRIAGSEWAGKFRYWGEVDRLEKMDFLRSLDILSVPTVYKDPKGLFVLEALANGVAVVQPSHGAFPELIEKTGGGLLVEPSSPASLAEGLLTLVRDREERERMARQGKEVVFREFSADTLAENALSLYSRFTDAPVLNN